MVIGSGTVPREVLKGKQMRAAVVPGFGKPLVIEDRPVPEPAPGQVVIRMEASGAPGTGRPQRGPAWLDVRVVSARPSSNPNERSS